MKQNWLVLISIRKLWHAKKFNFQLIADKVAYNIAKSEKAAQALLRMKKKQEEISGDYNMLKEVWLVKKTQSVRNFSNISSLYSN